MPHPRKGTLGTGSAYVLEGSVVTAKVFPLPLGPLGSSDSDRLCRCVSWAHKLLWGLCAQQTPPH